MGPAYFVIALLGCADGGSSCKPVATLETHYATEEQCAAAAGAALIENSNLDYPTLVARCHAARTESTDSEEKPREKGRPS